MSNTSATLTTRMRHECDKSTSQVLHERHKCGTSPARTKRVHTSPTRMTRVRHKSKILITTRVKHIFTPLYLLYGKRKTARRGKISFYKLPFGNALFSCQNAFKKYTTKTKQFFGKSYIKKLCARL